VGSFRFRAVSVRSAGLLAAALLGFVAACGDDDGDTGSQGSPPARIAVLSAFPAELAAVLERTSVEDTVEIAGRTVRLGTLGGKPVAVAMTGIGLVNAANTTRAMLEQLPIRGVVVSGVAGSSLNIADVAAVTAWSLPDGSEYPALIVFRRDGDKVRLFWASEMTREMADPGQDPRDAPDIASLWTVLDLTPEGRGTDWYPKLQY